MKVSWTSLQNSYGEAMADGTTTFAAVDILVKAAVDEEEEPVVEATG
jgi:hypothetical protein